MTRAHLHIVVSAATLFTLAGCPGSSVDTESGSASDSASSSGTTGEVTDGSATNNTMTGPVTTTMQTDPTGMTDSESNTGTTVNPTGDTSSTTDPKPECTEATAKDDCSDPAAPFCVNEECAACDKAGDPNVACAGLDPNAPVCNAGACVECTADEKSLCQGNKPVCGADNVCAACTEHSDCADTACNLETGACFGVEYIIYVDRAAPCEAGDGSMAAPFCKIGQAFEKMLGDDVTVGWTIKIKSGNYVEDPLVVPDGSLVAMNSWDGIQPKIRATPGSGHTLSVANESKLYIDNLAFNLNDEFNGVLCASADVWIDDSRMASNANQGYESTNCDTWIRRSVIFKNGGGGIASYGPGATWITNTFVTSNGTQVLEEYGGIRSAQENEMHINYSTVVNNLTAVGPRSLQCTADAGPGEIRNSVLIAFGGMSSIDCVGGVFSNSAVDDVQPGDTNIVATVMDIMTFFNPQMNGVYTAKPDTGLAALGLWKTGDPLTDFDGTARANMDGAADFAGADKP
jgi:hypothetical protein